ncbi:hypothetical protein [Thalassotalea litorea]|uniref:hypothetical protein n=1 Tax=Thalassotalea litorea TaxID=2020715 RepID=UPI003736316E
MTTAVCLHGLILFFLLPKPASIIDNSPITTPAVNIESYLYTPTTPPANNNSESEPVPLEAPMPSQAQAQAPLDAKRPRAPDNQQPAQEVEIATPKGIIETVPLNEKHQASTNKPANKPTNKPAKKAITFNSYKGLDSINQQQDRDISHHSTSQRSSAKGYSVFQPLPAPVPKSIVRKSAEQVRAQNTSIVGHETIEKRDGYCYQETDLSFINDEFGKVASISACGESSDDRYFREFMQQVRERR